MDKLKQLWQYKSKELNTSEYIVKIFTIYDDDPDLHVAAPIYEWQQTEEGKWVLEHSMPRPIYEYMPDLSSLGYRYAIRAFLTPDQITFFKLKYQ